MKSRLPINGNLLFVYVHLFHAHALKFISKTKNRKSFSIVILAHIVFQKRKSALTKYRTIAMTPPITETFNL